MGFDRSSGQSAGVRTFSTTKYHYNIDFGQVANSIEVQGFEVTNSDGEASRVMIGYKMPKIFVYDYDGSSTITDRTDDLAAGQITLGADGEIIIGSPVPLMSIEFDVDTAGGALSSKEYYNGALTSLTVGLETADITSTGLQSETFLLPNDILPLPADHALVTAGVHPGLYIYKADIASSAVIDSIKGYHFVYNYEDIPSGSTVSTTATMDLPAGAQPACFVENADAGNATNVIYRLK